MKKFFFTLLGSAFIFFSEIQANETILAKSSNLKSEQSKNQEEGIVFFTPPASWHMADSSLLPAHVRVMVVGKGPSTFPPSMNLSWEPYKGTLRQYLKIVKNMNDAHGYEWKDLGLIRTEAGNASLSQVDTKTQWGEVRLMHVILVKNENVYILTASALKNEFSVFYNDFFAAMRSLKVAKDLYEMIPDIQQRTQLKTATNKVKNQWQTLLAKEHTEHPSIDWKDLQENVFKSENFQNSSWKPFVEMLNQKYIRLGTEWISLFQQKTEAQLFELKA